jgi:serine protease Do
VTAGIVSAKDRVIPTGTYVAFIQTDVAINRGNSGGPLFNLEGKVVGINSWIFSQTGNYMGLSFAIPIDVVMNVVNQIKTKGKVVRGWMGVQTQEVSNELAQSFAMSRPYGALVSEISAGSPAEKAGFWVGDVVIAFNGRTVETAGELAPKVGMMTVGDKVQFEIIRQGEHKILELKVGALPEAKSLTGQESAVKIVNRLGIVVGNLTAEDRQVLDVDTEAVMVRAINTGSAFKAGIQQGDIVLNLNNAVIHSTADLDPILNAIAPGTTVAVLIQRKGKRFFLPLKIN